MKHYRFSFEVDIPNSLITVQYTGEPEGADLRDSMVDHMRGFEQAWRYDCIFDVRDYPNTFSDEDNKEIGRIWFQMTKGRDVGRRTAIVGNDPALEARIGTFQSAFPYRKYAYFDDFAAALEWVRSLGSSTSDEAQFI